MLAQGPNDCCAGMDILFTRAFVSGRDDRNHRSDGLNERTAEVCRAMMRHLEYFRLQVEFAFAVGRSQRPARFIVQVSRKEEIETTVIHAKDYRVAVDRMRC